MLIILIHNDGSGTSELANYDYQVLVNKNVIASGRVENHQRINGWEVLVERVLLEEEKMKQ